MVAAYRRVAFEEICVGGGGVVPGDVDVIPFAFEFDEVPGVVFPLTLGLGLCFVADGADGKSCGLAEF